MKTIYADSKSEYEFLGGMKKRAGEISLSVSEAVLKIIGEVREKGDEAVRSFGLQFDGAAPGRFEVPAEELKHAYEKYGGIPETSPAPCKGKHHGLP
jgi:histidinol dehydrogenase